MSEFLTPARAALCKEKAGQKYRPVNGTEAALFIDSFCSVCKRDRTCGILPRTMWLNAEHPEYPEEWQYGADGQPMCTAHEQLCACRITNLDGHCVECGKVAE